MRIDNMLAGARPIRAVARATSSRMTFASSSVNAPLTNTCASPRSITASSPTPSFQYPPHASANRRTALSATGRAVQTSHVSIYISRASIRALNRPGTTSLTHSRVSRAFFSTMTCRSSSISISAGSREGIESSNERGKTSTSGKCSRVESAVQVLRRTVPPLKAHVVSTDDLGLDICPVCRDLVTATG